MPENPARRAETTRQSAYVDWLEELDVSEDNPSDWNLWPPNQTVAKGTKNLTEAGYISVSRTGLWSSASSRRSDHLSIYHLFITISRADPTALLRNEKANQFYAPLNKNTKIIIHILPKTPSKSLYNPYHPFYLYQYPFEKKSCERVKIYPQTPLVWGRMRWSGEEGSICLERRYKRRVGYISHSCLQPFFIFLNVH